MTLCLVESHVGTFPTEPYNQGMLQRLNDAFSAGQKVTGADANFYLHEDLWASSAGWISRKRQLGTVQVPVVSLPEIAETWRRSFDPFNFMDPFGNGSPFPPGFNFKSPFDDDNNDQVEQQPSYPEEFRVDKAPDPIAFLRAL